MRNLKDLIQDIEQKGIIVLCADLPESKGRHEEYKGHKIIYLDKNLPEIEAINILLHEKAHLVNEDLHSNLTYIPTYSHRIEAQAEKDRIIDFLNLVNTEYPIDDKFNYADYMEKAHIPPKYENFLKEIATELYQKNQKKD